MSDLETQLTSDLESCYTKDVLALESVLSKWETVFHSRHYLILVAKWLLINLYGRKDGFLNQEVIKTS